jgi:hypothetical protein
MNSVIERVARFADIDTRRALGVPPGRLPKSDLVPRPTPPTTWRYFSALKKLVYMNFDESHDVYMWEVYTDIEPDGDAWCQGRWGDGRHRGVWRGTDDFIYFDKWEARHPFYFAGRPEIIPA